MDVKTIAGVGRLADAYDGFVLDLWGVLYDGGAVFPHALDAMARLRDGGARLVILSNGPRRAAAVATRIAAAGIPAGSYDGVMSSGEETWQLLNDPGGDSWYRSLGRRCFFLGPEGDRAMLDGLDLEEVPAAAEADFILDLGPLDPDHTIADYEAMLEAAAARRVPMICANPDLVVHRLGKVEICAGTMAERYEELGGFVRWHGKPHPSVYKSSLALLPGIERSHILAVGDSFRTDIRGANGAGLDSLLVTHGIHRDDLCHADGAPDAARIAHQGALAGAVPTWACGLFEW
ncbi:MAG: TIGR01459 family HAD-type hydrolase [Alphaproteobacteria bacterium]|nr:TIGR01459 family HAD-type hydrolase [Alphaproteobacteria bacterium]